MKRRVGRADLRRVSPFCRRPAGAAFLPDDAVAAADRVPRRQPALPVHGVLHRRGHAGALVPGRPDGGARRGAGHLHREEHGPELLAHRQVAPRAMAASACGFQ